MWNMKSVDWAKRIARGETAYDKTEREFLATAEIAREWRHANETARGWQELVEELERTNRQMVLAFVSVVVGIPLAIWFACG